MSFYFISLSSSCLPKFLLKTSEKKKKENCSLIKFYGNKRSADDHILTFDGFLAHESVLYFTLYENLEKIAEFSLKSSDLNYVSQRGLRRSSVEGKRQVKKLTSPRGYQSMHLRNAKNKIPYLTLLYYAVSYDENDTEYGQLFIKSIKVTFYLVFFLYFSF